MNFIVWLQIGGKMDKSEFCKFAMALKTYYPKETLIPNEQAMSLWYEQLKDISYETASLFLNKWVSSEKWSPTIADIRGETSDIVNGEVADWGHGWEQVEHCIRHFGYYREEDAINYMDDVTRQVVKRLGFKNLCMSDNPSTDRANFRMIYEELAKKEQKSRQLSPETKACLEQIAAATDRIGCDDGA